MLIGTGVNVVGSLFGGSKAANAAAQQAEMQNQAAIRKYGYDIQKWDLDKQMIQANRRHAMEEIKTKWTF